MERVTEAEDVGSGGSDYGIVFLHGSGDSGPGFLEWLQHCDPALLETLKQRRISYRAPSAPSRPYTLAGGCRSTVWHDRYELALDCREDLQGIQASVDIIDECIESLVSSEGIPASNIFLWGMSMGGHMALQALALSKYSSELAGIVALSCFLSTTSHMWKVMGEKKGTIRIPPIKIVHGEADDLIPCVWGQATSDMLTNVLGLDVAFSTIPHLRHDLCFEEVADILAWITSNTQNRS